MTSEAQKLKNREYYAKYRAANLEKCRERTRGYMARMRAEQPEKIKAANDRYLEKYPDRLKARKHEYYLKNKDNWNFFNERYRRENPEKYRAAIESWKKRNPDKVKETQKKNKSTPEAKARNAARQMRRHAQKLNATPSWANHEIIQEIYDFAAFMTATSGEKWEVDHTVPLISPLVCGLHWEGNLFAVPARENRSKGNRRWANKL